ncbi:MAG: universal stress protein [Bacteroidota bacterium]
MKKILIALDYSPAAEKVAQAGYGLAKSLKAEAILAHVITESAFYAMEYSPIMGYSGAYTSGAVEVVEDIRKEAENFLTAAAAHLGDPKISTKVLEGDTADAIRDYAAESNVDIIVVGSHSHHGLDRLFSTHVAGHLLKHSKTQLLIIPTDDN